MCVVLCSRSVCIQKQSIYTYVVVVVASSLFSYYHILSLSLLFVCCVTNKTKQKDHHLYSSLQCIDDGARLLYCFLFMTVEEKFRPLASSPFSFSFDYIPFCVICSRPKGVSPPSFRDISPTRLYSPFILATGDICLFRITG